MTQLSGTQRREEEREGSRGQGHHQPNPTLIKIQGAAEKQRHQSQREQEAQQQKQLQKQQQKQLQTAWKGGENVGAVRRWVLCIMLPAIVVSKHYQHVHPVWCAFPDPTIQ